MKNELVAPPLTPDQRKKQPIWELLEFRDRVSRLLCGLGVDHALQIRNGKVLVHQGPKTSVAVESDSGIRLVPERWR